MDILPIGISAVDDVIRLLSIASGQYFGEDVTQLEHALQCAHLAHAAGAEENVVLAALLHDIGHLVAEGDEWGNPDHDQLGAAYLESLGYGGTLIELVAQHVQAKRYLTATNPEYLARLSPASRQTLKLQGGPMTPEEAGDFAKHPLFRDALRLRAWDEAAKVPGLSVDGLRPYQEMLERQIR